MTGIYKITSPSGRVYIGISGDIKNRWSEYRGLRCKKQKMLYSSFIKHGVKNHLFEVIHELPKEIPLEVLHNYEILYIQLYKDCGVSMLNISAGGRGNRYQRTSEVSEETRIKIRQANTGRTHDQSFRDKVSRAMMGNKNGSGISKSAEQIQKIRQSLTGSKRNDESKIKMRHAKLGKPSVNKGRVHSDQSKQNMSLAKIGKKASEETKEKRSAALKKHYANAGDGVIGHNTVLTKEAVIEIFTNTSDNNTALGKKYGATRKTVSAVRNGLTWKHVTKYLKP